MKTKIIKLKEDKLSKEDLEIIDQAFRDGKLVVFLQKQSMDLVQMV